MADEKKKESKVWTVIIILIIVAVIGFGAYEVYQVNKQLNPPS